MSKIDLASGEPSVLELFRALRSSSVSSKNDCAMPYYIYARVGRRLEAEHWPDNLAIRLTVVEPITAAEDTTVVGVVGRLRSRPILAR